MKSLCKDCWIAHEIADLKGRCKVCVERTGIDRPEPLATKAKSIDVQHAKPIVCNIHPSEPLDVYCGTCPKRVSPRALVSERSVIAMVGDNRSGKTSLLWVLNERLRQTNPSGIFIREALGDSDETMAKAVEEILTKGDVPPTMATDANVRNYAWEVNTARGSTVIAFHDAAGEMWNNLPELAYEPYERFYRYLDLAGSIVFAIDGERLIESVQTIERGGVATRKAREAQVHELNIIRTLARRIGAREGDGHVPISATVTKTDTVWHDDRWSRFRPGSGATAEQIEEGVQALLLAAGRQSLLAEIRESFEPVRFFAVSAFGGAPLHPLRIEALRPERVEEPLLALLDGPPQT